jgi:hypothetical protein
MSLLHWCGTIVSLPHWWGIIMSLLDWWGDNYISPSMMGDYYVSPSLIGRCCFTINSSIFLLPLPKQLFILMLCAYRKNNKYQCLSSLPTIPLLFSVS